MKIAFLGDIAFLGQFDITSNANAKERLRVLKELLEEYDYAVANLESPFTEKTHSLVCKSMHLRTSPRNVELLKYLNIKAVTLANNHIADFGIDAVKETIRVLDEAGVQWFGIGGKKLDININGENIQFSGMCCYSSNGTHYGGKDGIDLLTRSALENHIREAKEKKEFPLVTIHWGLEHTNYPAYEHIKLMENVLKNETALVCGHHPHIIQGIQQFGESLVAYSLGNAIFDKCTSINNRFTVELNEDNRICMLLGVEIKEGKILNQKVQGFYISDEGIEKHDLGEKINRISTPLSWINDEKSYSAIRMEQFNRTIEKKFGKHDFKWLISRLNYYSIGARVTSVFRQRKYREEVKGFFK